MRALRPRALAAVILAATAALAVVPWLLGRTHSPAPGKRARVTIERLNGLPAVIREAVEASLESDGLPFVVSVVKAGPDRDGTDLVIELVARRTEFALRYPRSSTLLAAKECLATLASHPRVTSATLVSTVPWLHGGRPVASLSFTLSDSARRFAATHALRGEDIVALASSAWLWNGLI